MQYNRNKEQKIIDFTYHNPWCSTRITSRLLGISEKVVRKILNNSLEYEKIKIPVSKSVSNRRAKHVYFLLKSSQLKAFNKNRKPEFAGKALLQSAKRLSVARTLLASLPDAHESIDWIISPWKKSKNYLTIDIIMSIKSASNGNRSIVAIATPPFDVDLEWFSLHIRQWKESTKKHGITGTLVFWNPDWHPTLTIDQAKILSKSAEGIKGYCVIFTGASFDNLEKPLWVYLLPSEKLKKSSTPPWESNAAVLRDIPQKSLFMNNERKSPYPWGSSILYWKSKNANDILSQSITFVLKSKIAVIDFMFWMLSHPCCSAEIYSAIQGQANSGINSDRKLRAKFKERTLILKEFEFVEELIEFPGHYILTDKGMEALKLITGIPRKMLNKQFGSPYANTIYEWQTEHTDRIFQFIYSLAESKMLGAWQMNGVRQLFQDIQMVSGQVIRKMVVVPDSAGTIITKSNREFPFWLEVDRGTRQGLKFKKQTERYFLPFQAKYKPMVIPPLIYIIDTGTDNDEGRLRSFVRVLGHLYRRYSGTPLKVIVSTAHLLDKEKPLMRDKKAWRVFQRGIFYPETQTLSQALEASNKNQAIYTNLSKNIYRTNGHLAKSQEGMRQSK